MYSEVIISVSDPTALLGMQGEKRGIADLIKGLIPQHLQGMYNQSPSNLSILRPHQSIKPDVPALHRLEALDLQTINFPIHLWYYPLDFPFIRIFHRIQNLEVIVSPRRFKSHSLNCIGLYHDSNHVLHNP